MIGYGSGPPQMLLDILGLWCQQIRLYNFAAGCHKRTVESVDACGCMSCHGCLALASHACLLTACTHSFTSLGYGHDRWIWPRHWAMAIRQGRDSGKPTTQSCARRGRTYNASIKQNSGAHNTHSCTQVSKCSTHSLSQPPIRLTTKVLSCVTRTSIAGRSIVSGPLPTVTPPAAAVRRPAVATLASWTTKGHGPSLGYMLVVLGLGLVFSLVWRAEGTTPIVTMWFVPRVVSTGLRCIYLRPHSILSLVARPYTSGAINSGFV